MLSVYPIIKRRGIICLVFFLFTFALLYSLVNSKKVFYRAEATMVFIGEKGIFSPEAEARSIKDADFLAKVLKRTSDSSLSDLRKNLQPSFKKENIVSVSFVSADPSLARDVVNSACHLFLEERNGAIKDIKNHRQQRLKKLSNELAKLQSSLNSSQSKLRSLKAKNAKSDKRSIDLQQRLDELRLQKAELLKIFTERHPDVVNITSRIKPFEDQLENMSDNSIVYDELAAEIENETAELLMKQKEYDELYDSYKTQKEPWQVRLAEEAQLPSQPEGRQKKWYYAWGVLGTFLASVFWGVVLEATDRRIHTRQEAQEKLALPIIAEIDKAVLVKRRNSKSKKRPLLDYSSRSLALRRCEQLYTFLNVEIFKGDINKRTVLVTSAEQETGKTFIACHLALAAAKNGKKVLLVDASLRYPSVDMVFGLKDKEEAKGLSDVLRGSSSHKDVVRNLTDLLITGGLKLDEKELKGVDNLKILLAGTKVENPLGLFGAKELAELFKELSHVYGMLVIDSSAIRDYPATLNIAALSDALLLVVRKGRTSYPAVKDVMSRIKKVNGPLTGLVFSHVRTILEAKR